MYDILSFVIDNLFEILFWIIVLYFTVVLFIHRDFYGKGFLLKKQGKYLRAIEVFSEITKSPRPSHLYAKGYCNYMLGYFQHAIKNLEKAIELKLNRINVYYLLAVLYAEEGKFDIAFEYLEKGEKIQNNFGFLNKLTKHERNDYLGWVYHLKGESGKAIELYDAAIPIWMKNIQKLKKVNEYYSAPCYRMGVILLKKGDMESSKKLFSLAVMASPESIFARKSESELEAIAKDN